MADYSSLKMYCLMKSGFPIRNFFPLLKQVLHCSLVLLPSHPFHLCPLHRISKCSHNVTPYVPSPTSLSLSSSIPSPIPPTHSPVQSLDSPQQSSSPTLSSHDSSPSPISHDLPSLAVTHNCHPMQTRSKSGIFTTRLHPILLLTHMEPTNVAQALAAPHWAAAMKEEYDALMRNNTWTLVQPPSNRSPIGCKWVFGLKRTRWQA